MVKDSIYQKELLIIVMSSSIEKTFSTAGQGEDDPTGCLFDCDYIKNHYRLIAVDLSWQKKLDAGPKAVEQIEFFG